MRKAFRIDMERKKTLIIVYVYMIYVCVSSYV